MERVEEVRGVMRGVRRCEELLTDSKAIDARRITVRDKRANWKQRRLARKPCGMASLT